MSRPYIGDDILTEGEQVLAWSIVQDPRHIAREGAPRYQAVVTNQRFLMLPSRKRGEVVEEFPLDEIRGVEADRRRPIYLLGIPVVHLTIDLDSDQRILATSGIGSSRTLHLAEVLRTAMEDGTQPDPELQDEDTDM